MIPILALLVSSSLCAITRPLSVEPLTPNFAVSQTLVGNTLQVFAEKTRPGHFCYGFGKTMDIGDVFCLEFDDNKKPIFSDCKLIGHRRPQCSTPSTLWILKDQDLSDNRSRILVERDITKAPILPINAQSNDMIFTYSDTNKLNGHSGDNKARGTQVVPITSALNTPVSTIVNSQLPSNATSVSTVTTTTTTQPTSLLVPSTGGQSATLVVPTAAQPTLVVPTASVPQGTVLLTQPGATGAATPVVLAAQPRPLLVTTTTTVTNVTNVTAANSTLVNATGPMVLLGNPENYTNFVRCKFSNGICYQFDNDNRTIDGAGLIGVFCGLVMTLLVS